MPSHNDHVAQISSAVGVFFDNGQPFRIFHGFTNSTRPTDHRRIVDISCLSNVLKVDPSSRTALVEPNVPMDKLVQATLPHGLVPPVVMEFPGITVGGGFAGSAGESSSFRYGYFDQAVRSIEVVLADGRIITASSIENADLFKGAAGSLGTLGVITKLELQLIPARHFVKLVYRPYSTIHETIKALKQETENPANDYVDGIIFSRVHGVVMTGQLINEIPNTAKPNHFSGPWDPWFYLHVKSKTMDNPSTDYIPIFEYLFRYDRGGFWVGRQAFRYFNFIPFNRYTRWFVNDFMHTRMMYRILHASHMSSSFMIQDLSLPYDTVEEFIDDTSKSLGVWPLWLCPLRATDPPTFHPSHVADGKPQQMLNIGLWGPASMNESFVQQNRQLERRLTELGGRKVLYSHTYYPEEDFWALYDRKWYDELRRKYSATNLPTVWEKVKVDEPHMMQNQSWLQRLAFQWPFAGIIGIRHAIQSQDYLIHRQPSWIYWQARGSTYALDYAK
ncbi:FAD binding domain-containing protein [Fonsecaea pedrosoi]|nr:FAD binding domain-containing protein [Fonsecaea pedrosoi]